MAKKIVIIISILFFVGLCRIFAQEAQIGELFGRNKPVKVFLKEFTNESGESQISVEAFKKSLAQGLLNRKSTKFEIVSDPALSVIQISAKIKKYRYLKHGPISPIPGASVVWDVAASITENYAEMSAEYIVVDTKSNTIVWDSVVQASFKKSMTPQESIPLILDKISAKFIGRCFGKPYQGA